MTPTKELVARLEAEEKELVLDRFDEDRAWLLGSIIVNAARSHRAPVAVQIRRPGQLLFHAALSGATGDNDEWIRRKSAVVFRFYRSSFAVGVSLALAGLSIEEKYFVNASEYSAHGGAFPLRVKGAGLVACVAVSGLPQEEDHALVVGSLRRLLSGRY